MLHSAEKANSPIWGCRIPLVAFRVRASRLLDVAPGGAHRRLVAGGTRGILGNRASICRTRDLVGRHRNAPVADVARAASQAAAPAAGRDEPAPGDGPAGVGARAGTTDPGLERRPSVRRRGADARD